MLNTDKKLNFYYYNRQVAIADRIVINKKDLLSEGELEQLKEDLSSINTVADMIVTERSK